MIHRMRLKAFLTSCKYTKEPVMSICSSLSAMAGTRALFVGRCPFSKGERDRGERG